MNPATTPPLLALASLIPLLIGSLDARAHPSDHVGQEFVLAFPFIGNDLSFLLTSETATTGNVSIPAIAFSEDFSLSPGVVTTVTLPSDADDHFYNDRGILVTADQDIAVQGVAQLSNETSAYLGLPTDVLGTDHVLLGYPSANGGSNTQILMVATEDDTTITIVSSMTTGVLTAGAPYEVSLDRLGTLLLRADDFTDDPSGTTITSDKPIGVYTAANAEIPAGTPNGDRLVEQIPPTSTWGTTFLTVPLATRSAGDIFRVVARDDATDVYLDGTFAAQIDRGQVYELTLSSTSYHEIRTSGPAMVAQYSQSSGADPSLWDDAFQMTLPSVAQFRDYYTVAVPDITGRNGTAFTHHLNLVARTEDAACCTLDGVPIAESFTAIGSTDYSGVQLDVPAGAHIVECPHDFGVTVYGYTFLEGYGYPGGLELKSIAHYGECRAD